MVHLVESCESFSLRRLCLHFDFGERFSNSTLLVAIVVRTTQVIIKIRQKHSYLRVGGASKVFRDCLAW